MIAIMTSGVDKYSVYTVEVVYLALIIHPSILKKDHEEVVLYRPQIGCRA